MQMDCLQWLSLVTLEGTAMEAFSAHLLSDTTPLPIDTWWKKKIRFHIILREIEAFPLTRYLLRPYPKRTLDNVKRIFNYRLSRGRKTIVCAFGMASEKFQVLNGPILCRNPETVNDIIKAVCVLHSYVRKHEGVEYTPAEIQMSQRPRSDVCIPRIINANSTPTAFRNYVANYFLSPPVSLPWQWNYCVRENNSSESNELRTKLTSFH
jgi:hypothetical protein